LNRQEGEVLVILLKLLLKLFSVFSLLIDCFLFNQFYHVIHLFGSQSQKRLLFLSIL
jgi:hypothetical protein